MAKCKFKVGQVVSLRRINFYHKPPQCNEAYQQIGQITLWTGGIGGYCLHFRNGDSCHEKWAKPLTARERGEK